MMRWTQLRGVRKPLYIQWFVLGSLFFQMACATPFSSRKPSGANEKPYRLLLTYFEPFGGYEQNGSEILARRLAANPPPGIELSLCRLPVIYGEAWEKAKQCILESPVPIDDVLSLGESVCSFEFVTATYNRDLSPEIVDERGEARGFTVIEEGGPHASPATYSYDTLLCRADLSTEERAMTFLSPDPGAFVCNHVAYKMGRFLKKHFPHLRYGFLHVPYSNCFTPTRRPHYEPILRKFLSAARDHRTEPTELAWKTPEIRRILRGLDESEESICRRGFLENLQTRWIKFIGEETASRQSNPSATRWNEIRREWTKEERKRARKHQK